jgi:CHAT domain-containing protein
MESLLKPFVAFFLALLLTIMPSFWVGRSGAVVANEALIQQASQLYESGQYQQSKTLWQQLAESTREDAPRAVALGNLALTLQQLGEWQKADAAIASALKLAPRSAASTYAQLLDIQGHLDFARGRFPTALSAWQQAEKIYQNSTDKAGLLINRLNQSQALQMLGRFNQADKLIAALQGDLDQQRDPLFKLRELRSIVETSMKLGRFERLEQADKLLKLGDRTIAQLPSPQKEQEQAASALLLGNVARSLAERNRETNSATVAQTGNSCKTYLDIDSQTTNVALNTAKFALKNYQTASRLADRGHAIALQSNLNQLSLLQEIGESSAVLVPTIEAQLQGLPVNRPNIFAAINFAQSLLCNSALPDERIAKYLTQAVQNAQQIQDQRAESYALGTLAKVYEQQAIKLKGQPALYQKQLAYAQKLVEKALMISETIEAADISYQWQRQLGRILWETGDARNRQQALSVYYPSAVKSLETVRGELTGTNPDVQFSFRDNAEPVYREYVDLLLSEPNSSPAVLNQAIDLIDSLQVAELENFFRCVLSEFVEIRQVTKRDDPEAATFYPIILPDRLEVIVQLPNQDAPIRLTQKIPQAERTIDATTKTLLDALRNEVSYASEYKEPGAQIYRWLIEQAEPYLQQAKVKTLVFVLDGSLRNVPVAALWTGQEFVIQKYAVAVTPGLKLLGPKRFARQEFKALIGGLTSDRPTQPAPAPQPFPALPFVKDEVKGLQAVIPKSTVLVEDQFVPGNLAETLKRESFPIVHLATHGNFSSNPKQTYLVTAKDQYIDIDNLQELLRTGKGNRQDSLELLMLSACQTAQGNRRATLGMAGVAIRAGASSTVASLWSVSDQSTSILVDMFYQNLKQVIEQGNSTRVQALRQAQLALLDPQSEAGGKGEFSHPYFWAPFILLGNWL